MTNFTYILERLSSRAKNALIMAQLVSEELKHDHIGTEHLLYGVVSEKSSFAAEILTKTKLTPEIIKQAKSGRADAIATGASRITERLRRSPYLGRHKDSARSLGNV